LNTHSPVGAAIAAIFAMQPSIYRSWRYFLDQLQKTTVTSVNPTVSAMFIFRHIISTNTHTSPTAIGFGIVSAFVINITVFPPKPKRQFINQIQNVFNSMSFVSSD
jgi:uncharacterized membrane protein YgaE (UPF0421/DUF939 family)